MNITTATTNTASTNNQVIAAFMDDMAIQMDRSAETIRSSVPSTRVGNVLSQAASGIEERASQIRMVTRQFRDSGDMASFDQACQIAGWNPQPEALASFMSGASTNTLQ
jgi:hypothetical protein